MSQTIPITATPATLDRRLFALFYDLLPLLGLWFVAGMLTLVFTNGHFDPSNPHHQALARALIVALSAGYFVLSWTRGGQTVGMRAWNLRIVDCAGRRLAWPRALLRFAVGIISLVALGAGFWWSLIDPQCRTWHDIASNSLMTSVATKEQA
ncbi:MAG TPA: RDD family protein [Rudaea sp.]|nr:RDD family protein [Rudaea sp.]